MVIGFLLFSAIFLLDHFVMITVQAISDVCETLMLSSYIAILPFVNPTMSAVDWLQTCFTSRQSALRSTYNLMPCYNRATVELNCIKFGT